MKIPFLQHKGVGLHITDQAIRWVELSRVRNRISLEGAGSIEVKNGNIEKSLNELIDHVNPTWKFVTVNLDPENYFQKIMQVPYFDDESLMGEWLKKQKSELVPGGFEENEIKVVHHLFGDPEEGLSCQFIVAEREAIEQRINLLQSAGLKPVSIRAGALEAGYALMFNEDFNTGTTNLLRIFEDGASLLRYQQGLLHQIYEFPGDLTSAEEIQSEAQSTMLLGVNGAQTNPAEKVWQVASQYIESHNVDESNAGILDIHFARPLARPGNEEDVLDQDHSVACGMAVAQLYPLLDEINLLDNAEIEASNEAIEKKDTLVLGSALGGIAGLLLIVMLIIQMIFGNWSDKADARVNELEDKITAVSNARSKVAALKKNVETARQIVLKRSSFARLLREAGSVLPGDVWLTGLELDENATGSTRWSLRFKGYAEDDTKLTELLKHLEQKAALGSVRLVESRQEFSREIYDESSLRNVELTYFDIEMLGNGNEEGMP